MTSCVVAFAFAMSVFNGLAYVEMSRDVLTYRVCATGQKEILKHPTFPTYKVRGNTIHKVALICFPCDDYEARRGEILKEMREMRIKIQNALRLPLPSHD
jgi:hypothetical protein